MSAQPRHVPSSSGRTARCGARWHRSSHSTGMNNCVETASLGPRLLAVRDSKRTAGPVLLFSRATWSAFVADLVDGRAAPRIPREAARN